MQSYPANQVSAASAQLSRRSMQSVPGPGPALIPMAPTAVPQAYARGGATQAASVSTTTATTTSYKHTDIELPETFAVTSHLVGIDSLPRMYWATVAIVLLFHIVEIILLSIIVSRV